MDEPKMPELFRKRNMPEDAYWAMRYRDLSDNNPLRAKEERRKTIPVKWVNMFDSMPAIKVIELADKARKLIRSFYTFTGS